MITRVDQEREGRKNETAGSNTRLLKISYMCNLYPWILKVIFYSTGLYVKYKI